MKKYIYTIALALAAVVSSCSKSEELAPIANSKDVTLTLAATQPQTRATETVTLSRYAMEVYEDAACTYPAELFEGGTTHRKVQTTPTFTLTLDNTKTYTCLFWADNDAAGEVYNIANLRTVDIIENAEPVEGFYATHTVSTTAASHTITMNRAVAKVVLMETDKIKASSSLVTTFDHCISFDVKDGTALDSESKTITTTITNAVSGTSAAPAELASFYLFAPAAGTTIGISFTLNSEPAKELTNVPLRANYITNIKGEFSGITTKTLIATASDNWNVMDIELNGALLTAEELEAQLTTTTAKRWTISSTKTSDGTAIASVVSSALGAVSASARIFVTLPDVTSISASTFQYVTNLAAISLPKVTQIGDNAFHNCRNLKILIFGSIIDSWGTNVLSSGIEGNIDLTLHINQLNVSGNIWRGYAWKSISYVDANGNPVIK